ncbi:hypothetical protein [Phenylobacterium sp.]|uniref:hypothetical protein n=1 Tax=Phenylobacterium sp. TaxID=1871053 RepID=UPI002635F8FE|nr:hypothetical protein [Phenylobacterium sp.]
MLKDILDRIEQRIAALNTTPTAVSRAAGLSADTIRNFRRRADEDNALGLSTYTLLQLAPALQTTAAWLLDGTGPQGEPTVPLVGIVGETPGGAVRQLLDGQAGELIARPPGVGSGGMALDVGGPGLGSFAEQGAILYFGEPRAAEELIGRVALVKLEDESLVMARITRGPEPGLIDLDVLSGPIRTVRPVWAAQLVARLEPSIAEHALRAPDPSRPGHPRTHHSA